MKWFDYVFLAWLFEPNKASKEHNEKKRLRKARKKHLISTYGYDYYLRDRLWEKIKNQKKRDTYYTWKKRLLLYDFTVTGYDLKRNEQHYGKPMVHEYDFADAAYSPNDFQKPEERTMKLTLNLILQSFSQKPRDVLTCSNGVWFFVHSDGTDLYVEAAKEHKNTAKIKGSRKLDRANFDAIYLLYANNAPRKDYQSTTFHSSYWIGIFNLLSAENLSQNI